MYTVLNISRPAMNKSDLQKSNRFVYPMRLSFLYSMKLIWLVSLFFLAIFSTSCQSEYSERMDAAVRLKAQHDQIALIMADSRNPILQLQLNEIEQEIDFHAQVSGNKDVFLAEIWKQ
jgi:hypothetical protein